MVDGRAVSGLRVPSLSINHPSAGNPNFLSSFFHSSVFIPMQDTHTAASAIPGVGPADASNDDGHYDVLYNAGYGVFALSALAIHAVLKRLPHLLPVREQPEPEHELTPSQWAVILAADAEEKQRVSKTRLGWRSWSRDAQGVARGLGLNRFSRDDKELIGVLKEVGLDRCGRNSDIEVDSIPKGWLYRICEHDGNESVLPVYPSQQVIADLVHICRQLGPQSAKDVQAPEGGWKSNGFAQGLISSDDLQRDLAEAFEYERVDG